MTREQWCRIKSLYEMARATPAGDRELFIENAGRADPTVARELRSLLDAEKQAERFLEPLCPAEEVSPPTTVALGTVLAHCRILRIIGYGGMGIVFEAQQELPRRRVAIKVVRGDRCGDEADTRLFQREVDALARLQHPWIASVHEAGRTDDDQSYIIMEYVEGIPLDDYARRHSLPLRERLALFLKIVQAIAHAHGRGVIHGDLKPSNILITTEGAPRVLDFGLARIMDPDSAARLHTTHAGRIQGTIAYMSPEQLRDAGAGIDVCGEIYALGVLLYQLITGQLPHDTVGLPLPHAVRRITESPPIPPSERLSRLDDDVETIILKCLALDPARRYQTADELGRDLAHYLAGNPIEAKRDNAWYVLKKNIQRHKTGLGLASLFFALVLGFAATMTVQSARLTVERDTAVRARHAADWQRQRADWNLQNALGLHDQMLIRLSERHPGESPEIERLCRAMLGDALELYHNLLENEPNARMRMETARAYTRLAQLSRGLGLSQEAETAYGEAIALLSGLTSETGDEPAPQAELARAWNGLGTFLCDSGRNEEAYAAFQQAIERRRRLADAIPEVPAYRYDLGRSLTSIGRFLKGLGIPERAEDPLRQAIVELREVYSHAPDRIAFCDALVLAQFHLANALVETECLDEAECLYREAIQLAEPLMMRPDADEKFTHRNARLAWSLGRLLANRGHLEEAEEMLAQAVVLEGTIASEYPAYPRYRAHLDEMLDTLLIVMQMADSPTSGIIAFRRQDDPSEPR